jgi:hypothetical protein
MMPSVHAVKLRQSESSQNNALDADPPIASLLKSTLVGGGPVNATVRPWRSMMHSRIYVAIGFILSMQLPACAQESSKELIVKYSAIEFASKESQSIEELVDQLVFADGNASNEHVFSPGVNDKSPEYAQRFKKVQDAFDKLAKLKVKAFPILVKHLDDKRQSINFRNHYLANSVGDACMWNIYFQLQDRPGNYSKYGYQRKGRDGQNHPKPYWEGTPFDDAGGIAKWLEQNKDMSYTEMQIKCLNWLLEGEKKIGASDAESYFENILPLEIQILKRELEQGLDVRERLAAKEKNLRDRNVSAIPPEMLPSK